MSGGSVYKGKLYRAFNPVWAARPLSGEGAAQHGGRFNPRGLPALYCSLDPLSALREANQVGDLQPTVLVAFDADISDVFNSRAAAELQRFGMMRDSLGNPGWRDQMLRDGEAETQVFARKLLEAGYAGLRVRSFARGAGEEVVNLVLWRWGDDLPHRLTLIDDEQRLG